MKSNSSNLEQFIQQNRQAFDLAEPGAHNWPAIEQALDRLPNAGRLEQFILVHRALLDTEAPTENAWSNIERALDAPARPDADPLESFIHTHRESFDAETPDLRVWAAIEQQVPAQSAKTVPMHWSRNLLRAAAAVALLVTGIGIGVWYGQSNTSAQGGMAMSDVSSEYAELEHYYQRDITAKKEKLATLASYRDESLDDDLLQMDQVMSELRQELANVPPGNREQIVRAMIENYKAKAAILERVLEHLEQQQPATTNSGNHEVQKI